MTPLMETILFVVSLLILLTLGGGFLRTLLRRRSDDRLVERLGTTGRTAPRDETTVERGPFERVLLAAGIELPTLGGILALVLIAALFFVAVFFVLGLVLVATLAGLLAALVALAAVIEYGRWRSQRFEAQLVDGIDLMIAALQGGESPTQAIGSVSDVSSGLIRSEFGEIWRRLTVGMSIERAVGRLTSSYDSEGGRLFAQTLIAKWQIGGELAPVLRSVNQILRDRLKLRLHLEGQLAGARVASILVALVPYAILPFMAWKQPSWMVTLTTHPYGPPLLAAAIGLQVIGFLWLRSLLSREV